MSDHTIGLKRSHFDDFAAGRVISGISPLGGFEFNLDPSCPYVAAAIHDGDRMRPELLERLRLPRADLYREEDPETGEMIRSTRSWIIALDSRFEYDVNRDPARALMDRPLYAWGMKLYDEPLPDEVKERSLAKHAEFFQFMQKVCSKLLEYHGRCTLYDMHSYNRIRQIEKGIDPPVFNLGTAMLNKERWGGEIDSWAELLKAVTIPGVETTYGENAVFYGKGEFAIRALGFDPHILVLPTEVSKIYMNEETGEVFPEKVAALRAEYARIIEEHAGAYQTA